MRERNIVRGVGLEKPCISRSLGLGLDSMAIDGEDEGNALTYNGVAKGDVGLGTLRRCKIIHRLLRKGVVLDD